MVVLFDSDDTQPNSLKAWDCIWAGHCPTFVRRHACGQHRTRERPSVGGKVSFESEARALLWKGFATPTEAWQHAHEDKVLCEVSALHCFSPPTWATNCAISQPTLSDRQTVPILGALTLASRRCECRKSKVVGGQQKLEGRRRSRRQKVEGRRHK